MPNGTVLLSDVESVPVQWLWYGWIPAGKITVADGDPGLGKSIVSLDLAARISTGAPMPGEYDEQPPRGVVLLSAEDDLADTIRPRLDAADADCTRIVALRTVADLDDEDRPPSIPEDLPAIRAAIETVDAALVVVDPLMAFLSEGTDSHKDQSVRRVLHGLATLAQETGVAILLIRHLNKSAAGNPLYRGGGSIGIVAATRSGLVIARDPDDPERRVLASNKCNLAAQPDSLIFHLEHALDSSRIVWGGASSHTARDLLAEPVGEERSALEDAKDYLEATLANGPVRAGEVKRGAREGDISERTLNRAKKALGVECYQEAGRPHPGWLWKLPGHVANPTRQPDGGHVTSGWQSDTPSSENDGHEWQSDTPSEGHFATHESGNLTLLDGYSEGGGE